MTSCQCLGVFDLPFWLCATFFNRTKLPVDVTACGYLGIEATVVQQNSKDSQKDRM